MCGLIIVIIMIITIAIVIIVIVIVIVIIIIILVIITTDGGVAQTRLLREHEALASVLAINVWTSGVQGYVV